MSSALTPTSRGSWQSGLDGLVEARPAAPALGISLPLTWSLPESPSWEAGPQLLSQVGWVPLGK